MFEKYSHAIIDEMNLCHRLYATTSHLSYNGKGTGLIYSMLRHLIMMRNKGFAGQFVFCSDSKETWKKESGLGYKADRQKAVGGDFWTQVQKAREILSFANVKFVHADKFEADDCAYTILMRDRNGVLANATQILLCTQDSDWHYYMKDGDADMYTGKEILTKSQIEAALPMPLEKLIFFKVFRGCEHNNVKPLEGFDVAKTLEVIAEIEDFDRDILNQPSREVTGRMDEILENYYLVRPVICDNIQVTHPKKISADKIKDYMREYGIKSLVDKAHLLA